MGKGHGRGRGSVAVALIHVRTRRTFRKTTTSREADRPQLSMLATTKKRPADLSKPCAWFVCV